jgi:hypothetical protein
LREHIRDALFTRRISNFRVICPNRMIGLRPMLEDDKAKESASYEAETRSIPCKPHMRPWRLPWTTSLMRELDLSTLQGSMLALRQKNLGLTTISYAKAG